MNGLHEQRILVLAPFGRDAKLACEVLGQAGLSATACPDLASLLEEIRVGVGAVLLTEEVLTLEAQAALSAALALQPPWSDLPVIVFTATGGRGDPSKRMQHLLGVLGNVTFLERPMRVPTLVTAMKAALRARTRQYQARATLVTLEQQEEEARKRVGFEQQLIGIVSHDLRNPLHAILLSAASMSKQPGLDERMTRNLSRIRTSADRAVRLIRDLLDYTQARLGGGIRVSPEPANLHDVIRAAVDEVEQAHPNRELTFTTEGEGEGEWDADRIAQVATNLLSNALAYSPAGSKVRAHSRGEADKVCFSVHNEGPPIPAELQDRLFQPLERGTAAGDSSGRSIGLGLYIVHNIVRAHGGRIEVESKAGDGTTFTVHLPRRAPHGGR